LTAGLRHILTGERDAATPAANHGLSSPRSTILARWERAAVDDGQSALDSLLGRLADIPTPAGATPRQLGGSPAPTLLPIIEVRQGKPE
jgi:hypothetical protein